MRFHQVRELVEWAAQFHARLAAHYEQRAAGEVSERVAMALRYLAEHERQLQADLQGYAAEEGVHRGVLDAWFDDPEDFPHPPMLEQLPERRDDASVQDVLATALTAHRTLQDLYRHRGERASGQAEQQFFAALAARHEAEVRRTARDMQRLEDY